MKHKLSILQQCLKQKAVCGIAALGIAVSLPATAAVANDPTGSWDCITSGGGQDGITFLNFTTETVSNGFYYFNGFSLVAGKNGKGGTDGRGNTLGRGGSGSGSSSNVVRNLYGASPIEGSWFFDSKGRIVGSYYTVVNVTGQKTNYLATDTVFRSVTNSLAPSEVQSIPVAFTEGQATSEQTVFWNFPAPYTNKVSFPNTNIVVSPLGTTNSISFVGKVVPGKRLNLVASTLYGKVTFKGVPSADLGILLDGSTWTGTKISGGLSYLEFFHLTQFGLNAYLLDGQGPAYTYTSEDSGTGTQSFCLISRQKKIGICVAEFPFGSTIPLQRTTLGSFKISKKGTASFKTKGAGEPDLTVPVTFNAASVSLP